MSGYKTAGLTDIERRPGGRIPIRAHFDINAFGVNAWVGEHAGDTVIGPHIAGEEVDAPQGTIVFVRDPELWREAVAKEAGTTFLSLGGKPGEAFSVSNWERASPYATAAWRCTASSATPKPPPPSRKESRRSRTFRACTTTPRACTRWRATPIRRSSTCAQRSSSTPPSQSMPEKDSDFDPIRDRLSATLKELT